MNRRRFRVLLPTMLIALGATVTHAQSNPPPATSPTAQNPSPQTSSSPSNPGETAPAKKVWTNDDMGGAHAQPGVSTTQPARNPNANPRQKAAGGPRARGDAQWYHDHIAKLQAKLPPLDAQIAQLQAAINGEPTGDAKSSTRPKGVKAGDWRDELADARQKRDAVADKIAALQDEARHVGIPPNALP